MLDFIEEYPPSADSGTLPAPAPRGGGTGGGFFGFGGGKLATVAVPFGTNVMHQVCSLPPPLAKREFVMGRRVEFDSTSRSMQAYYASVDDARFPGQRQAVRAETSHTQWTFTSSRDADGRPCTTMVLESTVDTKLPIPGFILNYMQRFFPAKSLNAFRKICREEGHLYEVDPKHLPHDFDQW
jgi:hypothetical protein